MGFNLIYLYDKAELMHRIPREIQNLQLEPQHIGHQYDFEDMKETIDLFQKGKSIGKIVLKVKD